LESIRTVAAALCDPAPVDNLEKALRRSIEALRPATVAVQLVVNGDEQLASPTMLDEVFQVVREAVRNAFAHARARNVVVRIDILPPEVRLAVRDDGVGIASEAEAGGLGQAIMRERMASLGGSLKISSRPGRGTSIEGRAPLSQHS
jgi:signal transduction histidine kinase